MKTVTLILAALFITSVSSFFAGQAARDELVKRGQVHHRGGTLTCWYQ